METLRASELDQATHPYTRGLLASLPSIRRTARPAAGAQARSGMAAWREGGAVIEVRELCRPLRPRRAAGRRGRVASPSPEGETFGLVGESGCGKSTVLRALAGLNPDYAGEIRLDGEVVPPRRPRAFFARVQMVFQDPYGSLHPRQTDQHPAAGAAAQPGLDRIRLPPWPRRWMPSACPAPRLPLSASALGRPAPARRHRPRPDAAAGGAAARRADLGPRRVGAGRDPEPAEGSAGSAGLTYILVSHDLAVVAHMCDRIAVMQAGQIVDEFDAEALRAGTLRSIPIRANSWPRARLMARARPFRQPRQAEDRTVKITGIKTFLMHVGRPRRTGGPPTARSATCVIRSPSAARATGCSSRSTPMPASPASASAPAGRASSRRRCRISRALLVGEDPTHIERLWQKMHIAMMGHGMTGTVGAGAHDRHRHGAVGHQGQGARRAGLEPARRQGARPHPRLRPRQHAGASRCRLKERGFTAFKCGGVSDPVRKVATLREAVGDEMDIMIDLHGPPWLTPADAGAGRPRARALRPAVRRGPDRAREPRRLRAHPRRRQRAAGGRRAHVDDLRLARADRARSRRRRSSPTPAGPAASRR